MRYVSAHLVWLALLASCGFDVPSGVYECTTAADCPARFECVDGLCVGGGDPCPALTPPENGAVVPAGPVYPGLTATYSCDETRGFALEDEELATRRCGDGSRWMGAPASCVWRGCPDLLPPEHGSVDQGGAATSGAVAVYACESLYSMHGNEGERTRTCVDSVGWDGEEPTCMPNHGYAAWPLRRWSSPDFETDVDTVHDPVTGLVWQLVLDEETFTWVEAIAYCDELELAGRSDWRLPTRMELLSIVDYSTHLPSIDGAVFPSTPGTIFWTSSPFAENQAQAWAIHFYHGLVNPWLKITGARVRCVR